MIITVHTTFMDLYETVYIHSACTKQYCQHFLINSYEQYDLIALILEHLSYDYDYCQFILIMNFLRMIAYNVLVLIMPCSFM